MLRRPYPWDAIEYYADIDPPYWYKPDVSNSNLEIWWTNVITRQNFYWSLQHKEWCSVDTYHQIQLYAAACREIRGLEVWPNERFDYGD
jgi:hypothetical protein